jgi:hypothetical protein
LKSQRFLVQGEETKIQMYRRILATVRAKQEADEKRARPRSPELPGSDLLAAWGQAVVNLSPRTSPAPTSYSRIPTRKDIPHRRHHSILF